MNGHIVFRNVADLADFLAAFVRSKNTATFSVVDDARGWVLTFTGGY